MHHRHTKFGIAAIVLLLLGGTVCAQTGILRGRVFLKRSHRTSKPVQAAAIDVFRVDLSGLFTTRTDRSGRFVFAGLPYTGTYVIAASATKAKPSALAHVMAGRDEREYQIVLRPGDGARLTREEAVSLADRLWQKSQERAEAVKRRMRRSRK